MLCTQSLMQFGYFVIRIGYSNSFFMNFFTHSNKHLNELLKIVILYSNKHLNDIGVRM